MSRKTLGIVAAVVLALALAAGVGYVLGVRAVMQRVCQPVAAGDGAQPKSIPYPSLNCDLCYQSWPDWWCFVGGCPWP